MDSDDFEIRRASVGDVETLAALGARTFRDAYLKQSVPEDVEDYVASNFNPAQIAAQISDPDSVFLLAEVGGQPVGYAKLRSGPAPGCVRGRKPLELSRLYLDQRVIGRGHGRALMRACLDEAVRLGRETIWLGVWEQNLRARRFYEKWGFRQAGTHEFIFGGRSYEDPVLERPIRDEG
ncbi:MAG: GNAT family N-acetyltransferase [Acidobacteria bacterium]|nr:GNAT family N-acetyltransferase [Acidobacteriota bacterium]